MYAATPAVTACGDTCPFPRTLGVTLRPDGSHRVRRQVRGKRQDVRATSHAQALSLAESLYEPGARSVAPNRRVKIGAHLRRYVTETADVKPSTRRTYASLLRNYVEPYGAFCNRRLVDLNRDDVVALLDGLSHGRRIRRPLRPGTVVMVRNLLSGAMRQAMEEGLIAANPVSNIRVRNPRQRIHPPDHREVRMMLDHLDRAGDPWAALYRVSVGTGLRRGELLGLRREDCHLDGPEPYVWVEGTLDPHGREWSPSPKTDSSRREVSLTPDATLALRTWMARPVHPDNLDHLVFTTSSGRPVDARNLVRHFHRTAERSGAAAARQARLGDVAPMRFHDLRHYYAASAVEQRIDLVEIQHHLGHRSLTTTANVYGHLTRRAGANLALVVGAALQEAQ